MSQSRRHFLQSSAAFAMGFAGLHSLTGCAGRAQPLTEPYGPLAPDPAGVMDLPEGFTYSILSRTSDPMTDGFLVPGLPDGMATFAGEGGRTILVRNHELNSDSDPALGAFGANYELLDRLPQGSLFDAGADGRPCLGGTTTVIYDTASQRVEAQYLSLAGTLRNCAGGPTPWNSWITCEETVERAEGGLSRDHGYSFEVPASMQPQLAAPVPLVAMGRFNHEAVAVDPSSHAIYQTEDTQDGLIYRFLPLVPGRLQEGGRLQALAARGRPGLDTRNWEDAAVGIGEQLEVHWIDLEDIESPEDDLRHRGYASGAARFARGEGMWYGNEAVYFACTNGGSKKSGQIWRYRPSAYEGAGKESDHPGVLDLFVEPNDAGLIDNADNLTVTPWGDLIVCEDGSGEQFLVGITPEGGIYKFGRNALSDSELAGATFSPDGTTLFVNIQHDGLTLAITGPWQAAQVNSLPE